MTDSTSRKIPVLLLLGFILVYLLPLGFRPMVVPDEVRYGEISREMIATGDWIVPRLNGLRYFEKPVMGYWLNGLSMLAFGENPFAVRFPSAVAAGLSALMVWLLMRRTGSILAPPIFLTCFLVVGTGVFSVLDGMLTMFLTMAMTAFFFACDAPRRSWKEKGLLALFGMLCGMAFLTKGFLAFAVPVVAIVPYMFWAGRWKDLFRMAAIPIAAAVLVSLPWAVAVHLKEPDYWNYFFWQEHIKRFMAEDAQHKATFWTYFLAFPVAALPWSPLIPASVLGMDRSRARTPLFRYALCWFVFPFLFFSAASGKLLTYILPCFPPFAILLTEGLTAGVGKATGKAVQGGLIALVVIFSGILLGLIVIQATGVGGFVPYLHSWKTLAATSGLAGFIFCLGISLKKAMFGSKLLLVSLGAALFLTTIQLVLPDDTIEHKAPGALLLRNAARVLPETVLVSLEDPLRAVCWFYKRSDVFQLGAAGELAYGFGYPDGSHRLLDEATFIRLIHGHAPGRVVLVGKSKHYRNWKDRLPPPIFEDTSGPGGYVFAQY
ncbi:phospholipid carrier-dependent glycosyltransferase [uncultured Desulfosarcina sp.]|uniref:phospholipid carrier-dependent glycosyltransferase n=1 Tax=uncultured Desulfosarcina sp. TaxID=218289 RepID=UPI0029C873DB|nr:phospholipid carrier-dependent glycosyltransferase [uncultured Desulfosarcina sp.]